MTFFDMAEVFKTNIKDEESAKNIAAELKIVFPDSQISFDLEDCDSILKVVTDNFCFKTLVTTVKTFGFNIEELD